MVYKNTPLFLFKTEATWFYIVLLLLQCQSLNVTISLISSVYEEAMWVNSSTELIIVNSAF